MKTLIITPFLNEELILKKSIESILNLEVKPEKWILVNDGSTDNSLQIAEDLCQNIDWISIITLDTQNIKRNIGSKIISAFNKGLETVDHNDYEIIMKLDADVILPTNYLKEIIRAFKSDDRIGICGGVCILKDSLVREKVANTDHLRGPIKAYRLKCFNQIEGLMEKMGWDSIDEYKAMYLNWKVKVIENLTVVHLKPTNVKIGFGRAGFKNGIMLYTIRFDIPLLMTNVLKRLLWKPYIIQGLGVLYGYCYAFLSREEKIIDKKLGKFIRKYRYSKIAARFK